MIVMLCISASIWVYWLIDIFDARHPIPLQHRHTKTWHPLVVFLTLLTVLTMVTTSGITQVNKFLSSTDESKIEKKDESESKSLAGQAEKTDHETEPEIKTDLDQKGTLTFNLITYFVFYLVLVMPLFIVSEEQICEFGFRKNEVGTQIADGCVGFLIHLVPVLMVLLLTAPFRSDDAIHPLLIMVMQTFDWQIIALVTISVVVMAPLFEELIFRVLLQGFLQDRMNPAIAIVITSLAFGFIHGWPNMIPIFTFSLVLGYFFYRTNSYITVVVLHALFNLYNLLNALMATPEAIPP